MYYVKKVIPTKAIRLIKENEDFLLENGWVSSIAYDNENNISHAYVDTLEGKMKSNCGDYIMQGIKGEHWSIKADIFHDTYEPYDPIKHSVDTKGNSPEFKTGDKVLVPCLVKKSHPDYACIGIVDHQKYTYGKYGQVTWDSVIVDVDGYKHRFEKNEVTKLKM